MNAASFVAAAAQVGMGVERDPPAPLDSPELWRSVVELATKHRVAPLVGEALVRCPDLAVPASVRDALTAELFRSSATRLLCESAVVDVVRVLRSRGLDVLVLKGPTVAHTVYPRPELRIYHDVDVLCRVADYPTLYRALSDNGYTNAGTFEARGSHEQLADKPSVSESHSVRAFYHSSGDTKIEVHFDIFQLGLLDRHADDFWNEAVSLKVDGIQIRCLAPEHQFLHLAVHAHRHGYSRLSWLLELDVMVRRSFHSLDWKLMNRVARREGVGSMLRHALATAHGILGTPLPGLPGATLEERCLAPCYRVLWPFAKARKLDQHERHRLLHFLPDDADVRNVLYGLVLMGRRREKLDGIVRRLGSSAMGLVASSSLEPWRVDSPHSALSSAEQRAVNPRLKW